MLNFFHTIIIYPISQILELSYLAIYHLFNNAGIALCGVSVAVFLCTLPLSIAAEK
jgi:hypothetical protein